MWRFLLFVVMSLSTVALCGQSLSRAEGLFNRGDYDSAYIEYSKLLEAKPKDALLQYKAARTLFESGRYDEALPYFAFAAEKRVYSAYRYLGETCFRLYRFGDAQDAYRTYIGKRGEKMDSAEVAAVEAAIAKAKLGASMLNRVEDIAIIDSARVGKREFLSAYGLDRDFGSVRYTREIFPGEKSADAVAFVSGREDRMVFSSMEDSVLNLKISYQLIDGWSRPGLFAPELTTGEDENYPFVLPDGVTVYFASKGFNSLGGYDIFMSRYNSATDGYTLPQNIGMPFNSPANDYMMVIDEQNRIGWFATDRGQKEDSVVVYCFVPNAVRTLLQTTDTAYLRDAARLKAYRKADAPVGYADRTKGERQSTAGHAGSDIVAFVVNDDVVYYGAEDFVSDAAGKLFASMRAKERELDDVQRALDDKRREYMHGEKDDAARTAREIIALEAEINGLQLEIKALANEVRSVELEALTVAGKQQ